MPIPGSTVPRPSNRRASALHAPPPMRPPGPRRRRQTLHQPNTGPFAPQSHALEEVRAGRARKFLPPRPAPQNAWTWPAHHQTRTRTERERETRAGPQTQPAPATSQWPRRRSAPNHVLASGNPENSIAFPHDYATVGGHCSNNRSSHRAWHDAASNDAGFFHRAPTYGCNVKLKWRRCRHARGSSSMYTWGKQQRKKKTGGEGVNANPVGKGSRTRQRGDSNKMFPRETTPGNSYGRTTP